MQLTRNAFDPGMPFRTLKYLILRRSADRKMATNRKGKRRRSSSRNALNEHLSSRERARALASSIIKCRDHGFKPFARGLQLKQGRYGVSAAPFLTSATNTVPDDLFYRHFAVVKRSVGLDL